MNLPPPPPPGSSSGPPSGPPSSSQSPPSAPPPAGPPPPPGWPPAGGPWPQQPRREPWYARRLGPLPVLAWVAGVVLVLIVGGTAIAGISGDGTASDDTDPPTTETDAPISYPPTTDSAQPTTDPPSTDTVTVTTVTSVPRSNPPFTLPTLPTVTTTDATRLPPNTTVPPTTPPTVATTAPPPPPPTTPVATTAPSLPEFGEGTQIIGEDIKPGVYFATSEGDCYWERLSGLRGSIEEVIVNQFGSPRSIVQIAAGDVAFNSNRCGTWTAFLPANNPLPSFGPGDYAVGPEVAPGIYRADGGQDGSCYWIRSSSFGREFDATIDNSFGDVQPTVEIVDGDVLFSSTSCGTWTKLK